MVIVFKVLVPVFMPAPVHDGTLYRPHEVVDGQQQRPEPRQVKMHNQRHIYRSIHRTPTQACKNIVPDPVHQRPGRQVMTKLRSRRQRPVQETLVNPARMLRHPHHILKKVWRVRILVRIAVGMVHPVHHRVGAGRKERRTLEEPRQEVEHPFGFGTHGIHFMRGVPV